MRSIAVCGTLVVLALSLTSTSGGAAIAANTGVVLGTLDAVGGPGPGTARPLNGSITFRDSHETVFTASAGSNGVFLIRIPSGTYAITGRSPEYGSGDVACLSSGPLTVMVGTTIHAIVLCQER